MCYEHEYGQNWTKVGLKQIKSLIKSAVSFGQNWTKVGLKLGGLDQKHQKN